MADIPNKIDIIGSCWSIALVDYIEDDNKESLLGNIEDETRIISLSMRGNMVSQQVTLIHEAIHGIDFGMGLKLKERQVQGLANGIYHLIRNNPELMRWINS